MVNTGARSGPVRLMAPASVIISPSAAQAGNTIMHVKPRSEESGLPFFFNFFIFLSVGNRTKMECYAHKNRITHCGPANLNLQFRDYESVPSSLAFF